MVLNYPHKALPLVGAAHAQIFVVWSLGPSPLLLVTEPKTHKALLINMSAMPCGLTCHSLSNQCCAIQSLKLAFFDV